VDVAWYCERLAPEVEALAAAADAAGPDAPVPTCPEWTVRDLVDHIGGVHRWATAMVRDVAQERYRRDRLDLRTPDDPAAYPAWLRAGVEPMIAAFAAADPGAAMWAWGADQHARFWPRRMVHETAVHRVDAELAAGLEPVVAADVAVDGVDELLENLPSAAYFRPRVDELRGEGETIALTAADAGTSWVITLEPERFRWARVEADVPDATAGLRATASDLYLAAYARLAIDGERVVASGDDALLARWLECSAL
jgi:uncharacterized protein (TIGR03083 family)